MPQNLFGKIEQMFDQVVDAQSAAGRELLAQLLALHHADIAEFLSNLSSERFEKLFSRFDLDTQLDVFQHLTPSYKAQALVLVDDKQKLAFLEHMDMDELSDLVDFVSDEELKHYFSLLGRSHREKIISLLQLKPSSVGTVMDINVVSLHENFTVARSIQILQRLRPEQELHKTIYITDLHQQLVGAIGLEDLVLQAPGAVLASFMKPNEFVANIEDDQEVVSQKMRHYQLTSAPVVGKDNHFLGAITAETLVDIVEEEAGEDILRISAASSIRHTYFETPFGRMLMQRGSILFVLMLIESFSSVIISNYEHILTSLGLGLFIAMLISTGGNTSTQASAFVVQGLASGEITNQNMRRFLRREFMMAFCLALILGVTAFLRVHYLGHLAILTSFAVGVSIGMVVLPFILKKVGLDPAFAAAPFLATGMDLLGLFLYCSISSVIVHCAFFSNIPFVETIRSLGQCVGVL